MSREHRKYSLFNSDGSDFEPATDHMLFGYVSCAQISWLETLTCRLIKTEMFPLAMIVRTGIYRSS